MAKKPFDLDLKHNPKRNGYNLGKDILFSAKPSELLPVWHRSVLPTDNFKIRVKHKTRTKPVNSAAYTRIREYFDFFFVPYSFLWKNAKQVHTQNTTNSVAAVSPYSNLSVGNYVPQIAIDSIYGISSYINSEIPPSIFTKLNSKFTGASDYFGFNRACQMTKLLNYLGYPHITQSDLEFMVAPLEGNLSRFDNGVFGNWVQHRVSLYPLLAYNAIYYTFFRNKIWETNQPYNYNVDYISNVGIISYDTTSEQRFWDNPTLFDMKYSNFPKDLFFGILPDSQEGEVSLADVDIVPTDDSRFSDKVDVFVKDSTGQDVAPTMKSTGGTTSTSVLYELEAQYLGSGDGVDGSKLYTRVNDLTKSLQGKLSILELRKASFIQRYREIIGSGDLDYQKIIYKLFGVEISNEQEGLPVYLGGDTSDINISEIVNNNLSGDNEAVIKGKGETSATTSEIEFTNPNKEYGIIMCIYHAQPQVLYALDNMHFDVAKVDADDYANPVFDQLGFEEIPNQFFTTNRNSVNLNNNGMLGYTTRYFEYKMDVGRVMGSFKVDVENGNTQGWIAPVTEDLLMLPTGQRPVESIYNVGVNFFKMSPRILDPIFTVKADDYVTSDPLDVFANFEVHAVRPLDYHGFPY